MPSALVTLAPSVARAHCATLTLTGRASPELLGWLAAQCADANDCEESRVGHLRSALFHLDRAGASVRAQGHVGQELAKALLVEEGRRGNRYGFQVGSAGQVR